MVEVVRRMQDQERNGEIKRNIGGRRRKEDADVRERKREREREKEKGRKEKK